jgi:hypothetical protein
MSVGTAVFKSYKQDILADNWVAIIGLAREIKNITLRPLLKSLL